MRVPLLACLTLAFANASADDPSETAAAPQNIFGKECAKTYEGDFFEWIAESIFPSLDANGDGTLDKSEVSASVISHLDNNADEKISLGEMTMAKAKALFNALDLDEDGELTTAEVPRALIENIENADGFEENNDGKVDTVEFSNFHASRVKKRGRSMSGAEIVILLVAFGVGVVAMFMVAQSWRSNTSTESEEQAFLGVEEYQLDYPPEVAAFQELRDEGGADQTSLKRALMKRALATVPMRLYVQTEERNVQRLYQNSMISPTSWDNFQACIEEVKAEMEVIKDEADSIQEGWSETILQEAHWLHQHIQEEKKQAQSIKDQFRLKQEAAVKAKREAEAASANKAKAAEQEVIERERAIKELEREAEREAEKKRGLTQRKNSGKKK